MHQNHSCCPLEQTLAEPHAVLCRERRTTWNRSTQPNIRHSHQIIRKPSNLGTVITIASLIYTLNGKKKKKQFNVPTVIYWSEPYPTGCTQFLLPNTEEAVPVLPAPLELFARSQGSQIPTTLTYPKKSCPTHSYLSSWAVSCFLQRVFNPTRIITEPNHGGSKTHPTYNLGILLWGQA